MWIDLGDVKNLAEVKGTQGGGNRTPFRVDATTAMKPGANQVSIKVINRVNRSSGTRSPALPRSTGDHLADVHPYKAKSVLMPSGLLGPVKVISVE